MSSEASEAPSSRLLAEQVRFLYEKAPVSIAATLGVGAAVVYFVYGRVGPGLSLSWATSLLLLSAIRALGYLRYGRRSSHKVAKSAAPVLLLTLASGAAWGVGGVLFYATGDLELQMLLVFAIGGICTGATVSLGSYGPAFLAFVVPAALPLALRLLLDGDALHLAMGAMATLYVLAVSAMGWATARRFGETVRLRLENDEMASVIARRAEVAVARFRAVLDQAEECVLVATEDELEVTDGNAAAARLLGTGPAGIVGRPLTDLAVEADGPVDWRALATRAKREGPVVTEVSALSAQSERKQLEARVSVHTFDEESYVLVVAVDITARNQLKEQLVQTSLMASVGTLAAGVAHEINNPLTYIVSNVEFLSQELGELEAIDEKKRKVYEAALAECLDGARRIRGIVSDLGAVARDPGDEPVRVDVNEVIESCLNVAASDLSRRARVVRDLSDVVPVLGDPTRLAQVFLNLIVNAAQSMDPGRQAENSITLRTRNDSVRRVVRVEVEDTGEGIPEAVRDRVFDPFFTTREVGSGTGLGLSLCRSIVSRFGGQISFETQEGAGTRFIVELKPAREISTVVHPAELPPEPATPPSAPPAREGSGTILVIDDDPRVADGISRALRCFDVQVTHGGDEALKLLRKRDFRLILCDLMMPGLSGIDVYERVKAEMPGHEERIVFLTGGAFTREAQNFLKEIPNHSIKKPFEIKALRDFTERWLSQDEA